VDGQVRDNSAARQDGQRPRSPRHNRRERGWVRGELARRDQKLEERKVKAQQKVHKAHKGRKARQGSDSRCDGYGRVYSKFQWS